MSTTTATQGGGARVQVQRFGTFLSNMVMPNIGAFIAWGFITSLFIKVGWLPLMGIGTAENSWVAALGGWGEYDGKGIVGPMITYLLPLLIGYFLSALTPTGKPQPTISPTRPHSTPTKKTRSFEGTYRASPAPVWAWEGGVARAKAPSRAQANMGRTANMRWLREGEWGVDSAGG